MKTPELTKMETISGGRFLSCFSQETGGVGTLAGITAGLAFGSNPVGWGILILGGISLAAGVASDPSACG